MKNKYPLNNPSFPILIFLIFMLLLPLTGIGENDPFQRSHTQNLGWLKNEGQFHSKIAYATRTSDMKVYILIDGKIEYHFKEQNNWFSFSESGSDISNFNPIGKQKSDTKIQFIKNKKVVNNSGNFNEIQFENYFGSIDINLKKINGNIEKILKVSESDELDKFEMQFQGADELCINEDRELQVDLNENSFYFSAPIAWQEINGNRNPVEVEYTVGDKYTYGFHIGLHNNNYPIWIDPLLSSGYIGGESQDKIKDIKIGSNGLVYVCGETESLDFPFTENAFDEEYNDTTDVFVAIFSPDLRKLQSCTFFGGSANDFVNDMVLDTSNNVYLAGYTNSIDFPTTQDAYDQEFDDIGSFWFHDMFISCLNSDASELLYSTYLGSKGEDYAKAIDLDKNQNIILTAHSLNGIAAVGPQFTDHVSGHFVMIKMNDKLSQLLASNALEANNYFPSRELVVDSSDQVFILGDTWATDIPVSPYCFADTSSGKRDVFVMRLNNDINEILACTYIGGKEQEYGYAIITDSINNVYISGSTESEDFPLSQYPFDHILEYNNQPVADAYICKLDSSLRSLEYSTFLGEEGEEIAYDLALDSLNNIFITGTTTSAKFPVFCNSFDQYKDLDIDIFIARLNPELDSLISSTYIGGRGSDIVNAIALNEGDSVYIAGFTNSDDLPIVYPFDSSYHGGSSDAFLLSIDPSLDGIYPCCTQMNHPTPFTDNHPRDLIIEWEKSEGATGYYVNVFTQTVSSIFDLDTLIYAGDTSSLQLSSLPCGDTVYVQIQPVNENGFPDSLMHCDISWFKIAEPFVSHENAMICDSDTLYWQGLLLTEEGNYSRSYNSQSGCDSSYHLNLFHYPNHVSIELASFCEGETYPWQGSELLEPGFYEIILQNSFGCDSIIQLELTMNPSYQSSSEAEICEGEIYEWEGFVLSQSGLYSITLNTEENCDSVIFLNLLVHPSFVSDDTVSLCEGEIFIWHNQVILSEGDFEAIYSTQNACDSLYFLHVNQAESYYFSEEIEICGGDTLFWQGMELTEPGEFFEIYPTSQGCDSVYYLYLSEIILDTNLYLSGDTLFTHFYPNTNYQWLDCNSMNVIENANEYFYVPDTIGSYAALLSENNCTDTTTCFDYLPSNVKEINSFDLKFYPNPNLNGKLFIEHNRNANLQIRITSIDGNHILERTLLKEEKNLDISHLVSGIYLVEFSDNGQKEVRKLIIQ